MENKIVTMASREFGTVRKIYESGNALYCARDVAIALGYATPQKAVYDHCKGVLKRNTPTNSGVQKMSFIPEADVYRLICHSKLPSALEFEKWVFEDVVPKAVNEKLPTNAEQPEQITLETSEYHYFPKTLKGEPVITIADFEHFTGVSRNSVCNYAKKLCKRGEEYFLLSSAGIVQFKRENPSVSRLVSELIVLKASAVRKLLKYFGLSVKIPMLEEKKQPPVMAPAPRREYVLKREPSEEMKSLMEHLHNEIKAIEGISYMLLCPDTKDNHENQREQLVKRIRALRDYSYDVSTILIE